MSKAISGARIILGLIFTVFGINGFVGFLPEPEVTGKAAEFLGGLLAAGYFMPFLKATETICGLLLLSGRFVPLALVVLAPIVINILLFHTLAPEGLPVAVVLVVLMAILAWGYRGSFASVLDSGATPTA